MAKPKKIEANTVLLNAIKAGTVTHVSQQEAIDAGLNATPPLVEVNTAADQIVNGKAPVRLSAAGHAHIGATAGADAPSASPYAVQTGIELPPSKRGNRGGGGAPKQYPFDNLEVGAFFFVPVSDKHPDPVKKLGSTVSSANMRYAVDTGETKQVTRTKRGAGNKAELDANGQKIREIATVAVHKMTRKFVIRGVEAGKVYGAFTAPSNGAVIVRTE